MRQDLKNMDNNLPAGRQEFKTAVIGGTFDHLHIGHKEFIKFALNLSEKLIMGLTSDGYIKKVSSSKYQVSSMESYEERKQSLKKFLREERVEDRVEIVKIDDVYGTAINKGLEMEAIIVVKKTLKGAELINIRRQELGLLPLEIVITPTINAEDGEEISSSRIRNGEIDRNGKLWINPVWLAQSLTLPDSLREELKKPFGELIVDDNFGNIEMPLITVGDITTQKFNKLSLNQKISVIDFNVNREKRFDRILELGFSEDTEVIKVDNPAGQITPELFKAIISAFSKEGRVIIEVLGEEDLAVLPVILSAPLGSTVFYGQPEEGVVKVTVSEEAKEKTHKLLTEFNK